MAVRASEAVRAVASLAPLLGVMPRPDAAREGISAIVRVRGEEEWIEPALLSIRDFADEIVVLDNGAAPGTRATIDRVCRTAGAYLRVEDCPELDLFALSNRGLDLATRRWVIRWDADFVGHTSGEGDLRRLREFLLGLDRRRYDLVYVPCAEVAGDLEHQFPDRRVRWDGQVHTWSSRARYVASTRTMPVGRLAAADRLHRDGDTVRLTLESLSVPRIYRVRRWTAVTYFHVHVKSARRLLLRHLWLEWLGTGDFRTCPTLEAYARAQLPRRWGTEDLDEAADRFTAEWCAPLVPVDPRVTGPYPELLDLRRTQPRYEVIRRNGCVAGRREAVMR
jgi:hypothetical protein